jgi:hypothetical protein
MATTRQMKLMLGSWEAVHATRLKVLLAASSAQHLTPSRLTICVEAVFALCNSS